VFDLAAILFNPIFLIFLSRGTWVHLDVGIALIFAAGRKDVAHADLVAYGPQSVQRFLIQDWLQEFIQYVRPNQCVVIEQLR
jgi:hypothetical protein